MSFGEPRFLPFLLLVPLAWLALVWVNRQRRARLALLGDSALIARLVGNVNWRGRRWQRRLWVLGVGLAIIALARPQWGTATEIVEQEGVQLMVALDVSNSMLAEDLRPNRLTRAKQEIDELMRILNGDELGLVLFSGASFIQFPLTSDYETARSFLESAHPNMISLPGTAIGDAIRTAQRGFDENRASQKVILIVTDGEDHVGDPVNVATQAAQEGVIIYTLGFGSADGQPIPVYDQFGNQAGYKRDSNGQVVISQLDELTLTEIAEVTGGRYYHATGSGREIEAFADELEALEQGKLDSRLQVQLIERYPIFVLLAVVSLIGAELMPERRNGGRG